MAYQTTYGYFMPRSYGIVFILHSYLHLLGSCFLRVFSVGAYLNTKQNLSLLSSQIRLLIHCKDLHCVSEFRKKNDMQTVNDTFYYYNN